MTKNWKNCDLKLRIWRIKRKKCRLSWRHVNWETESIEENIDHGAKIVNARDYENDQGQSDDRVLDDARNQSMNRSASVMWCMFWTGKMVKLFCEHWHFCNILWAVINSSIFVCLFVSLICHLILRSNFDSDIDKLISALIINKHTLTTDTALHYFLFKEMPVYFDWLSKICK